MILRSGSIRSTSPVSVKRSAFDFAASAAVPLEAAFTAGLEQLATNPTEPKKSTRGAKTARPNLAPFGPFCGERPLDFMSLRIRRRKKLSKGLRQAASPLLLGLCSAH